MSENRFSKELEISNTNNVFDSALFSDRDKLCSEEADIVIDCEDFSVSEITNITASSIIKYYSYTLTENVTCKIEWTNQHITYAAIDKLDNKYFLEAIDQKRLKVIGNIYENPELLEDEE